MRPRLRVTRFLRRRLTLVAGAASLAGTLALAACQPSGGPRPLIVGEDSCDFCRMAISDTRYGGEVRTRTGRLVTFDAVECLAGYVAAAGDTARLAGIWVADFNGGGMVPAAEARYLMGGSLHSPMGRQITSFAGSASPSELLRAYGGEVLTWEQVRARASSPPQGAESMSHDSMSHDGMSHGMSHDPVPGTTSRETTSHDSPSRAH